MRGYNLCSIELAQHHGACPAPQAAHIASTLMHRYCQFCAASHAHFNMSSLQQLQVAVKGQWVTRLGGNAAAAALRVSLVEALAPSARSSSKELGALRPF